MGLGHPAKEFGIFYLGKCHQRELYKCDITAEGDSDDKRVSRVQGKGRLRAEQPVRKRLDCLRK